MVDSLKTEREFIGKITKIRQVVKGLQRFVEVTVGCVTQTGDSTNCSANNRYDDDFVDDDIDEDIDDDTNKDKEETIILDNNGIDIIFKEFIKIKYEKNCFNIFIL